MVPDGYTVDLVAGSDLVDYPMFATLDNTGRLFVFESVGNVYETSEQAVESPRFRIKLLIDQDQDGTYDQATVFADKLSFPQGGVFIDGSLIASSAPDLLKLTDTDGDGVADEREVLLSGWTLNVNANSLIGPFLGPDGWLYLTSAIEGFDVTSKEGEQLKGETARIWRVRPDGSDLEWISAGGMNNPVELAFTPAGEVIGTQTFFVSPQRGVRDAITYWIEGGIYGKKNSNIDRDGLPRTGGLLPVVSQYSRVAPAGIGGYRSKLLGADYQDNLFSTQFNTHQITRHIVERVGGSFKTADSPFLWSDDEDFHPTDVLEDADGSLLVVGTGGRFILGCPLSQVSKPQLKGAIYRITKKDAINVEDPYGNAIDWTGLSVQSLGEHLDDQRPFVSDRAQQELITRGDEAVEIFDKVLRESASTSAKIKSVYGLYQINSSRALNVIRAGFDQLQPSLAVATAKAAGLSKSREFTEDLISLLSSSNSAVVRQSITALGQIGDPLAIEPLLELARSSEDRFVNHAIIYSLILLNNPEPLQALLNGSSGKLASTLLLALDQMPSGGLAVESVMPFLADPSLMETTLLVARRHPEWSDQLVTYLNRTIAAGQLNGQELTRFGPLLTDYCASTAMQQFLSNLLDSDSDESFEIAINSMGNCSVDSFPEAWYHQLSRVLLTSNDPVKLSQVVSLVNLRGLSGLDTELNQLVSNNKLPADLRISCVKAILSANPSLSEQNFNFLTANLLDTNAPVSNQAAATVLASADLNEPQLSTITSEVLPDLDPFLLPRLLPAFEKSSNPEIGHELVAYLSDLPSLDNFTEDYLNQLFSSYPDELAAPLNELLSKLSTLRSERIQRITNLEQSLALGSEENGRELYFGKAICWTCHAVQEGGGTLGPDLTSIQKDRSVHDIIEAIVYPSVSFVREYETYKITTATNEYRGIIKEQTPEIVVLGTTPETDVRIRVSEIQSIEQQNTSMMPQGLDQLLTEQEFADLLAYLMARDLVY